ncbi:MAG: general secretion pathway protein GspB [Rubrivivax sp.]|nr:general secretion pathway protein GspB [Rubrivivax sp.]
MSYILDALRRSQAERERGQVPGLDARPAAVAALPEAASGPPWRWLALAALVLGAAALGLLWWLRGASPTAPTVPTVAVMPVPEAVSRPGTEAAPETPTAPNTATLPIVVSAPVPPPAVASPPRPGAAPVAAAPAVAPAAVAPVGPASAAAPPAATLLSALSPALRRELPPLVMGGSIWSDSALSRFVIVNGQVVREGETAAPGVVVERIGPKAVWLRWRDLRLEVPL